ncbi:hypothetical protein L1887_51603 [Cichorium endivia]|nr:hypothetical protein L1887_51603 [Cichorium endivia]
MRHIERPFVGIDVCVFRIRGREERHVERYTAVEEDLCIVLVEKRLDAHHAIAVVDEGAHDRVDAPVGAARHLHLGLDIELARSGSTLFARLNAVAFASARGEVELGRVEIADGLAQTRTPLGMRVVVQVDTAGKLGGDGIEDVRWRLPVHKALAEIDGGGEDDWIEKSPHIDACVELGMDALGALSGPARGTAGGGRCGGHGGATSACERCGGAGKGDGGNALRQGRQELHARPAPVSQWLFWCCSAEASTGVVVGGHGRRSEKTGRRGSAGTVRA